MASRYTALANKIHKFWGYMPSSSHNISKQSINPVDFFTPFYGHISVYSVSTFQ